MLPTTQNRNLRRNLVPGLLAWALTPFLKPLLFCLRVKSDKNAPATIFASYMVGDLFMALPALKILIQSVPAGTIRILCRPDCVELLAREGMIGIPFANSFPIRPGISSFISTWRSAWTLRGRLGSEALDLDADPRTAFWLKIAGVRSVISYRRAFGVLLDETFELTRPSLHQADRDLRVIEQWLLRARIPVCAHLSPAPRSPSSTRAPWIISVWTRKASKNWPLDRWDSLLEKLSAEDVAFVILEPPDGDSEFHAFQTRWKSRVEFLRGSLTQIHDVVHTCKGVIATDNFLGHMAGYQGKPVLWINMSSPEEQVKPRGPHTIVVSNPQVEQAWQAFNELRSGDPR